MEGTDTPRSNSAREAPHRHPWAAGPRDPAKLPANVPKPKRGKPLRPRHLSHVGIGYTGQAANASAGSPPQMAERIRVPHGEDPCDPAVLHDQADE